MTPDSWARLQGPFGAEAVAWQIVEVSEDGSRARFRPQLTREAITHRLNEVAGTSGWSTSFLPLGGSALCCNLAIEGVTRSVVQDLPPDRSASAVADEALARAAEQFGMRPPPQADPDEWVDIDTQSLVPLYPPAIAQPPDLAPSPPVEVSESDKPAGQQAIDRLVERLKAEGHGLEAAKLLVEHGGYGSSPEKGRELYARLRALLKGDAVEKA